MTGADGPIPAPEVDWLAVCRRAAQRVGEALERLPTTADRARALGVGEGGDVTLAIDAAAEDAIFAELESLRLPLTAVSEERGEARLGGGGPVRVVIDPIDGSLNAKRGLPFYAVSLAVAPGETMGHVELGYVRDLPSGEEWWAVRGEGAFLDGRRLPRLPDGRLEIVDIETARPPLVARAADAIANLGSDRVRAIGSVALSLCFVATGRLDGMVSLRPVRSVDTAAGQLIVREVGGAVAFPDAAEDPLQVPLDLGMRSRVLAASGPEQLDELRALATG
jgi:myo-inositol-1(or 4)-monophosphatase